MMKAYLVTDKPLTFEECIVWARLQFEDNFNNSIRQLLFSLPKDAVSIRLNPHIIILCCCSRSLPLASHSGPVPNVPQTR